MAKRTPWKLREVLVERRDGTQKNIEDMSPEELRATAQRINDAAMAAIGYYRIGGPDDPNVQQVS